MKLRFKATPIHRIHRAEFFVQDGGTIEVSEERGRILLRNFPQNFKQVEPKKIEKPITADSSDKMVADSGKIKQKTKLKKKVKRK